MKVFLDVQKFLASDYLTENHLLSVITSFIDDESVYIEGDGMLTNYHIDNLIGSSEAQVLQIDQEHVAYILSGYDDIRVDSLPITLVLDIANQVAQHCPQLALLNSVFYNGEWTSAEQPHNCDLVLSDFSIDSCIEPYSITKDDSTYLTINYPTFDIFLREGGCSTKDPKVAFGYHKTLDSLTDRERKEIRDYRGYDDEIVLTNSDVSMKFGSVTRKVGDAAAKAFAIQQEWSFLSVEGLNEWQKQMFREGIKFVKAYADYGMVNTTFYEFTSEYNPDLNLYDTYTLFVNLDRAFGGGSYKYYPMNSQDEMIQGDDEVVRRLGRYIDYISSINR